MLGRLTRELLRREQVPTPFLWILAADGMAAWYRWLSRGLRDHLQDNTRPVISRCIAQAFTRRYQALRTIHPALPDPAHDPRAPALTIRALYRAPSATSILWVLDAIGGPPRTLQENLRSFRLVRALDYRTRWIEVATHLGEVLIALTTGLPKEGLPQANALLGRLCFDGGVKYAEQMRRTFDLPRTPESAIEVLRTSEYVFRVNPEHWSAADAASHSGFLEGTACPWYTASGWSMMHCGVFGQFQSGISSVFGLRYQLTRTIPKHGGHTCRVDLRPVPAARDKHPA
jgi:hypothetical protein